jgi:hypothetical protein
MSRLALWKNLQEPDLTTLQGWMRECHDFCRVARLGTQLGNDVGVKGWELKGGSSHQVAEFFSSFSWGFQPWRTSAHSEWCVIFSSVVTILPLPDVKPSLDQPMMKDNRQP